MLLLTTRSWHRKLQDVGVIFGHRKRLFGGSDEFNLQVVDIDDFDWHGK
jgi:hypothetical protein